MITGHNNTPEKKNKRQETITDIKKITRTSIKTKHISTDDYSRKIRKNLPMLITERKDIKTLLGMGWLG